MLHHSILAIAILGLCVLPQRSAANEIDAKYVGIWSYSYVTGSQSVTLRVTEVIKLNKDGSFETFARSVATGVGVEEVDSGWKKELEGKWSVTGSKLRLEVSGKTIELTVSIEEQGGSRYLVLTLGENTQKMKFLQ